MSKPAEKGNKKKKNEEEIEGEGEDERPRSEHLKLAENVEQYGEFMKNGTNKLVMIFVSASWCGPADEIRENVETLAKKYTRSVFFEMDFNNKFFFNLFKDLGITCVPTLAMVKNGRVSQKVIGSDHRIYERKIRQELGINDAKWEGLDVKWEYTPPEEEEAEEEGEKEEKQDNEPKSKEVAKEESKAPIKPSRPGRTPSTQNVETKKPSTESVVASKKVEPPQQSRVVLSARKVVRSKAGSDGLSEKLGKRSVIRPDENTDGVGAGGANTVSGKVVVGGAASRTGGTGKLDLSKRSVVRRPSRPAARKGSKGRRWVLGDDGKK